MPGSRWLQTEWPDLKVFCTSVTEQWATIAISGPDSRRLLAELAPEIDVPSREAFPHMSMREGGSAACRRACSESASTGELGFEIQVPASFGRVWEACIEAGANYAITPYGTEAMHVLRAEKGWASSLARILDGTVTRTISAWTGSCRSERPTSSAAARSVAPTCAV